MMTRWTNKILNNDYLFSIVAKVGGLTFGILLSSLTARFFGAELKGIISVIDNEASLYAVFFGLGIYQAYPFFRKKDPELFQRYVNTISTVFLLLGFILVIVASYCFVNRDIAQAVVFLIVPVSVYTKQLNYVVLIENPKRRNLSSLVISITEIMVIVLFMAFTEASLYVAIAYCCSVHISNLILSFANLRLNPLKIRFSLKGILSYIKFGFIPMLVYFCMTVNYKIDIQMLKWMRCVDYERIGIYATGVALATKVWLIPDAIKDILLSKLVKGSKDDEVACVIRSNLLVSVLASILLVLLGKPIIYILYGDAFADTYYVMVLLFTGIIGMIFYKMVYSYNISRGKRGVNLVILGGAAIVNVIGNYFTIPFYGIWGACITSVVSYLMCGLSFLIYFQRQSGIPYCKILFVQREDVFAVKRFISSKSSSQ